MIEKRSLNAEKEKKKIPNQADIPENSLYTPSAQRKAVSRAMKSLPKNPKKFAVVIEMWSIQLHHGRGQSYQLEML